MFLVTKSLEQMAGCELTTTVDGSALCDVRRRIFQFIYKGSNRAEPKIPAEFSPPTLPTVYVSPQLNARSLTAPCGWLLAPFLAAWKKKFRVENKQWRCKVYNQCMAVKKENFSCIIATHKSNTCPGGRGVLCECYSDCKQALFTPCRAPPYGPRLQPWQWHQAAGWQEDQIIQITLQRQLRRPPPANQGTVRGTESSVADMKTSSFLLPTEDKLHLQH